MWSLAVRRSFPISLRGGACTDKPEKDCMIVCMPPITPPPKWAHQLRHHSNAGNRKAGGDRRKRAAIKNSFLRMAFDFSASEVLQGKGGIGGDCVCVHGEWWALALFFRGDRVHTQG